MNLRRIMPSLKQGRAKGRPDPAWIAEDEPVQTEEQAALLAAFDELSTDRVRQISNAGVSVGPIPWTTIDRYCERNGLDRTTAEWFTAAMRSLDAAYLEMEMERLTKEADAAAAAARRASGG